MIDEQLELLRRSDAEPTEAQPETSFEPLGEEIAYEDFAKLDMRVGTVVTAEPVKGADRLLRLEVDLGFEQRQVVAGIAEQFKPENLSGRKVVVVANLKPRKLRGLESQGMILMAEDREGRLSFLQSDGEPGSKVS